MQGAGAWVISQRRWSCASPSLAIRWAIYIFCVLILWFNPCSPQESYRIFSSFPFFFFLFGIRLFPFVMNRDVKNNPLYIQSFTEADDALKLHHIVHCSLDVVDERGTISICACIWMSVVWLIDCTIFIWTLLLLTVANDLMSPDDMVSVCIHLYVQWIIQENLALHWMRHFWDCSIQLRIIKCKKISVCLLVWSISDTNLMRHFIHVCIDTYTLAQVWGYVGI